MKATLDSLCYEMEKYPNKVDVQIKCIHGLGPVLKSEKDEEIFQRALDCVAAAISNNNGEPNIIVTAIQMFMTLIQYPKIWPMLLNSDIVNQLITITSIVKDDEQISDLSLTAIEKLIQIPTMRNQFNDNLFVKVLIAVSRLNTKSEAHANHTINISMLLDPSLGIVLKKLCSILIIYSQNFLNEEELQARLLHSFLNIATSEILHEIASVALPHFVQISDYYPNDFVIFKNVLILATRSPSEYCPKSLVDSILLHSERLIKNGDVLATAISILASKMKPDDIPPSVIPLSYYAMMSLISDQKYVKQALTVCFHGLSKVHGECPPNINLLSAMSSILMIHSDNASIIRRTSVVIHLLVHYLDQLAENVIAQSLLKVANAMIDDPKTVSIAVLSLASFINESKIFGSQLDKAKNISMINSIIEKNKDDVVITTNCLIILRAIVLSKYEFDRFIELSADKKSIYQIDSSICAHAIKESLDDLLIVKAALLLMSPTVEESDIISKAMNKYSSDPEVMISGLSQNCFDIDAITAAVLLCKEDALRYALPILDKTKEKLPTQLIEYLLSLDRQDVIETLLLHANRASSEFIGNQFQLTYVSQIPLAHELYRNNLFEPKETDYNLILQAMYESMFNPKQLIASLFFVKQFGIDDEAFPFLINSIKQNPGKSEIVSNCAEFITSFRPSEKIQETAFEVNAISIVANAMQLNQNNSDTITKCMNLLHFFSYFQNLDSLFVQTLSIPLIIDMAKKYPKCIQTMCSIFANIIRDSNIANYLTNMNISKLIFKNFGRHCYQLVIELLEQCNMPITKEQFDIVIADLSAKGQPTAMEAYNLLRIIQMCFQMNLRPKKSMKYQLLIPFLNVFPSETLIVQIVAELLPETKGYEDDNELLFALLEALRSNQQNKDVVTSIIVLLPKFEKHKNTLNANSTIELMLNLVDRYKRDVLISSCAFEILKGHPESFHAAVTSLSCFKDKQAILVVAQCIISYITEIDPSESLGQILKAIKVNNDNCDICSYLTPAAFFCSTNEQTYDALIKYINILANTCVKFVNNVNICRAVVGIICNLSEASHFILQLLQTPTCVIMSMKSHPKDEQLITAACNVISNFALNGKGKLYIDAIPVLILALKNRVNLQLVCQTIIDLGELVDDFSGAVAEELMLIIKKEQNKIIPSKCLLVISACEGSQEAIFSKLPVIFETITTSTDDELTAVMLGISSNLSDHQKLRMFEPFIPQLITMMRDQRGRNAIPAAGCCLNLARNRPESLIQFIDTFALISESSKGDLGKICGSVRDELLLSK
ncbi:hypothetical protein TRFO_38094 [Tritrichomonas foetus]|uniref:Uncharacterized protein n=1 Tax=Tritrichomonas foetus TaxID=1144522 RepID=A0A1J4J9E3_9EUKA|nr:hypothetical protein TRFO_38094 [Tritrichomonas foetus]|eukprot:OHS95768.1 hypothetical protein TRFO_38094 [Tritrichomonas foetus]